MNSGPQFESKSFSFVGEYVYIKHPTIPVYCPQTNGRAKRCNRTIVTRLQRYVASQQRNRDFFIHPSTNAYTSHVCRSIKTSSYSLVLSRHSPGPSQICATTIVPRANIVETSPEAMHNLLQHLILVYEARKAHIRLNAKQDTSQTSITANPRRQNLVPGAMSFSKIRLCAEISALLTPSRAKHTKTTNASNRSLQNMTGTWKDASNRRRRNSSSSVNRWCISRTYNNVYRVTSSKFAIMRLSFSTTSRLQRPGKNRICRGPFGLAHWKAHQEKNML